MRKYKKPDFNVEHFIANIAVAGCKTDNNYTYSINADSDPIDVLCVSGQTDTYVFINNSGCITQATGASLVYLPSAITVSGSDEGRTAMYSIATTGTYISGNYTIAAGWYICWGSNGSKYNHYGSISGNFLESVLNYNPS